MKLTIIFNKNIKTIEADAFKLSDITYLSEEKGISPSMNFCVLAYHRDRPGEKLPSFNCDEPLNQALVKYKIGSIGIEEYKAYSVRNLEIDHNGKLKTNSARMLKKVIRDQIKTILWPKKLTYPKIK